MQTLQWGLLFYGWDLTAWSWLPTGSGRSQAAAVTVLPERCFVLSSPSRLGSNLVPCWVMCLDEVLIQICTRNAGMLLQCLHQWVPQHVDFSWEIQLILSWLLEGGIVVATLVDHMATADKALEGFLNLLSDLCVLWQRLLVNIMSINFIQGAKADLQFAQAWQFMFNSWRLMLTNTLWLYSR